MSIFSDAIERLFSVHCSPRQVRAIEGGASSAALWREIANSGFQDALVPEAIGGAGLGLAEVFDVLTACGRYCLPVPLSLTMFARGVLASAGRHLPEGPITLATVVHEDGGALRCDRVPYALSAQWVAVVRKDACALLPVTEAKLIPTGVYGSLEGDLAFDPSIAQAEWFGSSTDWRAAGACLFAAQMVGAMGRLLADTIRHANERSQFGRSIGKFQAIQQQISVMAEQVFAARMAAQMGCVGFVSGLVPLPAAMAKARTGDAAVRAAAIAHAVHGAIGIAEEFDLQLFTRRLHEWRLAFGSETYWNRRIGKVLLQESAESSVEFARRRLSPALLLSA